MKIFILITSLILFIAPSSFAKKKAKEIQLLTGTVISCHDGDTCRVKTEADVVSVRFAGIDAPEIKQSLGVKAKNFTESMIKGKTVNLECDGKSFNRITCTVFQAGLNINSEIVRQGWAYEAKRYSRGKYTFAEAQAKSKLLGIWSESSQMSPYCFRQKKQNKKCKINPAYQD